MQVLPSKELLSEVLNIHIGLIELKPILENNKTDVAYLLKGSQNTAQEVHRNHKRINIYELAHKCKEWAHKLGFMVQSYQYNTKARVDLLKSCDIDEIFIEETEPEAIFKACEWIMEQTK